MQPKFSIVTTCMGRLDHLKRTLPRMLEQPDTEVIVVDYSCPQGTAAYVAEHFPKAKVVKVEGQDAFSNWRARNAGAAAATGRLLVFSDADTLLKPNAMQWIGDHLQPRTFGHFDRVATSRFNTTKLRLGFNQLRGFHVLPLAMFRRFGGYDEVLEGYAAGADTDLEARMVLFGMKRLVLDPEIVEQVIEHDNEDRVRHHKMPIRISYAAGYLYRKAKVALLRIRRRPNLPLPMRQKLYAAAMKAATGLGEGQDRALINVDVESEGVGMPLQLGYKKARFKMTLSCSITGEDAVDEIPAHIEE